MGIRESIPPPCGHGVHDENRPASPPPPPRKTTPPQNWNEYPVIPPSESDPIMEKLLNGIFRDLAEACNELKKTRTEQQRLKIAVRELRDRVAEIEDFLNL